VIGGSGGAQRCDAVNNVKSGEEHLCVEARRWAVRVSEVKEHLCAALSRKPKCMTAIARLGVQGMLKCMLLCKLCKCVGVYV